MRRSGRLATLALISLLFIGAGTGCRAVTGAVNTVRRPLTPVQTVVLATDATNAANQLGELVEQLRASAHKLHQARVLPVETDNAVQRAAMAFADAKDKAVVAFAAAQSPLQLVAAAAPLVGQAGAIVAMLSSVGVSNASRLTGTAGLLTQQLPPLLTAARTQIKALEGVK